MPTVLPQYEAQVSPIDPVRPDVRLSSAVGDALQNVGSTISNIAQRIDQHQKQRDGLQASLGLQSLNEQFNHDLTCLLYTSDAADE